MLQKLRNKDLVYVRTDESNNVVIIDKNEYNDRVNVWLLNATMKKSHEIPFKNDPRTEWVTPKNQKSVQWSRVSCFTCIKSNVTEIYAPPKTHKHGNKMRPIASNINTPTYKLAKLLVNEVEKLPQLIVYRSKTR